MTQVIINGRIVTPKAILENHSLVIKDGKIAAIVEGNNTSGYDKVIDAQGNYVAPGNIDMHIHGGDGADFTDGTPEAFYKIARVHAIHGTTSMFATLAASPRNVIDNCLKVCEECMKDPKEGANILGIHIEGNYLSPNMVGAQDANCITKPDPAEYTAIADSTTALKRWTAAPEIEGALEFGKFATSRGIVVALGHTQAAYKEVLAGYENGYVLATHFYNAMTNVHKNREFKKEGTVEACYLVDGMNVEVISDGIHVPATILKLIYKIKGADKIALITDAQKPTGGNDTSTLDPKRFLIEDGVVKLADRSALAGSIATTDRLVRTMIQQAEVPVLDAFKMGSETPARIMKVIDRKGTLEVGKDADIIIVNDNIDVQKTIVMGKLIYEN
ncbi:N-acetylglucosamine-6-phosphate deacetylase [Tritrichomonas foetus]|uniref:N-acetylglucosamine-6-phosphate deacetylase n=1 Tax=Tritrichomonas foetus TaxID=1144522 RepID=A0A1J4L332_9EUKA|nr:N-acetylglucosamine-6-phosphate deacetylase [Tritrichomonas foetus]|eukprot:OHT16325.1 N-acetylglucosamine-6-phosphate deacetylase [Tritrichomonas foetus]